MIYAILNQDFKTLSEERSSTFNSFNCQRREWKQTVFLRFYFSLSGRIRRSGMMNLV